MQELYNVHQTAVAALITFSSLLLHPGDLVDQAPPQHTKAVPMCSRLHPLFPHCRIHMSSRNVNAVSAAAAFWPLWQQRATTP